MKKLLLSLLAPTLLMGAAAPAAAAPFTVSQNVRRAGTAEALKNSIKDAINTVMENCPSPYYATGDDLAAFWDLLDRFLNAYELTEEHVGIFGSAVEQMGDLVSSSLGYDELVSSCKKIALSLFGGVGIELTFDIAPVNGKNIMMVPVNIGGMVMSLPCPALAPLPISLNYVAPSGYEDLSARSYLGHPSNYRGFQVPRYSGNTDIKLETGVFFTPALDYLIAFDSVSSEGVSSSFSKIIAELDKYDADYSKSWIDVYAGSAYTNLKAEISSYRVYNSSGHASHDFPVDMFIFNDDLQYIGINIGDLLYSVENKPEDIAYISGSAFDFSQAENLQSYTNASTYVEFEIPHSLADGGTKAFAVNIDDNLTLDQIVAQVSAIDLFGAPVIVEVEKTDYVPGAKAVSTTVLKGTDKYGQTAHATLLITGQDRTKPLATLKKPIRLRATSVITEEALLEFFTVSDNVDSIGHGLTYSFTLPDGFKFGSALVFGIYNLTLNLIDSSGNTFSLDFPVDVYDDVAPVFSRIDGNLSDPVVVGFSRVGQPNFINTILSFYRATDAVDGDCEVRYSHGGPSSGEIGDSTMYLLASDKSGNTANLTITVSVAADIPPVFIFSDKLAIANNDTVLDLTELAQIARAFVPATSSNLEIVDAKNYLATPTIKGNYKIKYSYIDNGQTVKDEMTLRVLDDSDLPTPETPKKPGFWSSLFEAFKTVFSSNVDQATATQWLYVVGSILTGFVALVLVVLILKKILG